MYAIEMDSVIKTYGDIIALGPVNIGVTWGSFTAVVGLAGSGKTTLLRCAAGSLVPTSGIVRRCCPAAELATFAGEAEAPAEPDEESTGWRAEVMTRLGLEDLAEAHAAEHRLRVRIARSLLARPDLVLADEPTRGLDAAYRDPVVQLLRHLVDVHQRTVLMATVDPVVAAHADVAVFLQDGRFVDAISEPTATAVARELAELRSLRP